MPIIKWEPSNDLESFFGGGIFPKMPKLGWDLAVDVYEEGDAVIAKMSLPGVNPDDLEISIDDDLLTISGSRDEEKETNEKNYYSKEIRRGSFSRTVDLPTDVYAEKAEAEYKDGVLTVTMPSLESEEKRGVKVEVKR